MTTTPNIGRVLGIRSNMPPMPAPETQLPLLYWAGLRQTGRGLWWKDVPTRCQQPHCGGAMDVDEPAWLIEGRVYCLACGRESARISAKGWERWFRR